MVACHLPYFNFAGRMDKGFFILVRLLFVLCLPHALLPSLLPSLLHPLVHFCQLLWLVNGVQ